MQSFKVPFEDYGNDSLLKILECKVSQWRCVDNTCQYYKSLTNSDYFLEAGICSFSYVFTKGFSDRLQIFH
jgi:hypothetical protein